jgi:hypothetical protein
MTPDERVDWMLARGVVRYVADGVEVQISEQVVQHAYLQRLAAVHPPVPAPTAVDPHGPEAVPPEYDDESPQQRVRRLAEQAALEGDEP